MGVQDCGLNLGYIDGEVDVRARAGGHAEFVGADEPAGEPHGVVARDGMDGFGPVVCTGESDELTGIAADRAGIHAGL